ncbi:hypothetical protein WJX73_008094 [Symbiochloris irregularis]|uniref:Uncharacterized protein n=1 Tax=Symbiochloris irregularis TaxID=706552 RepID=A0AAW1P8P0_9CHLO
MCSPAGFTACGIISVFGAVFMGIIALMVGADYEYLGEWYKVPSEDESAPPVGTYEEQKAAALKNCWTVAAFYLGFAVLCGIGLCYYSLRARRG